MQNISALISWRLRPTHLYRLKIFIHLAAALPLTVTLYQGINDQLGADPVKALIHFTGMGGLNLLLLTLLVSPAAKSLKQPLLLKTRRLLGLYCFCYALCHFLAFLFFEIQLEWQFLLNEIVDRPYISVGFIALIILTILAVTSLDKLKRQLGRKWQTLHNWVYLAAILVTLHFIWSVKSDIIEPLIYWILLLLLLAVRRNKLRRWLLPGVLLNANSDKKDLN